MTPAAAITAGMRAQRNRDLQAAMSGAWGIEHCDRMKAWCWWGWYVHKRDGIGKPGVDL